MTEPRQPEAIHVERDPSTPGGVLLRSVDDLAGPAVTLTRQRWADFREQVKAGGYDE